MRWKVDYFKHFAMFSSQFSNSFTNTTFLNKYKRHYCINYLRTRNRNTLDKFINHFFKWRKENWSHKIFKQLFQSLTKCYTGIWKVLHNIVPNIASPIFHVWTWGRSVYIWASLQNPLRSRIKLRAYNIDTKPCFIKEIVSCFSIEHYIYSCFFSKFSQKMLTIGMAF